jgi:hypothetical protein
VELALHLVAVVVLVVLEEPLLLALELQTLLLELALHTLLVVLGYLVAAQVAQAMLLLTRVMAEMQDAHKGLCLDWAALV